MSNAWYRILMTPWRYKYIRETAKIKRCIFCELVNADPSKDRENYLLYRGRHSMIVMNLYPYNTGHLMVAPYRHVPSIVDLNDDECLEVMKLIKASISSLRKAYNPDGFNIGVNIGRAAGAGIEDHVHFHIIPRWVGDTSFITIVSATKTLPQSLDETYETLKPLIDRELGAHH